MGLSIIFILELLVFSLYILKLIIKYISNCDYYVFLRNRPFYHYEMVLFILWRIFLLDINVSIYFSDPQQLLCCSSQSFSLHILNPALCQGVKGSPYVKFWRRFLHTSLLSANLPLKFKPSYQAWTPIPAVSSQWDFSACIPSSCTEVRKVFPGQHVCVCQRSCFRCLLYNAWKAVASNFVLFCNSLQREKSTVTKQNKIYLGNSMMAGCRNQHFLMVLNVLYIPVR